MITKHSRFKKYLLKKDPDKVILSADKGNCVVVMDKHDYREKALSLLNNRNTYSILKSDPTGKTQRGLNASDGLSPRFFGLPKIHKPEIPLRPIVFFVNSPTYGFSSFFGENVVPCGGEYQKHCQKHLSFCRICKR